MFVRLSPFLMFLPDKAEAFLNYLSMYNCLSFHLGRNKELIQTLFFVLRCCFDGMSTSFCVYIFDIGTRMVQSHPFVLLLGDTSTRWISEESEGIVFKA